MRTKETAGDYRYFPDPNVMPVIIDDDWYEGIKATLPEFPEVKRAKYINEYGLSEYDADRIAQSIALCECFEAAFEVCGNAKEAANWMTTEIMRLLNAKQMTYDMLSIDGKALGKLILLVTDGKVSRANGKKILDVMFEDEAVDPEAYAKENDLIMSNDTGLVDKVISEVLASETKAVSDYKSGKEKAIMSIFGKCMRELKGNCDPQVLKSMLVEAINKL